MPVGEKNQKRLQQKVPPTVKQTQGLRKQAATLIDQQPHLLGKREEGKAVVEERKIKKRPRLVVFSGVDQAPEFNASQRKRGGV